MDKKLIKSISFLLTFVMVFSITLNSQVFIAKAEGASNLVINGDFSSGLNNCTSEDENDNGDESLVKVENGNLIHSNANYTDKSIITYQTINDLGGTP